MTTLSPGEVNDETNPKLDLVVGLAIVDLSFRVLDISTPAKRVTPVQVFPLTTPPSFFVADPTQDGPAGHRVSTGRFFAPYTVDVAEAVGDHRIEWRYDVTGGGPIVDVSEEFTVLGSLAAPADQYCTIQEVRDEGYTEAVFDDARVSMLIQLASSYVDKVTGRWFSPRTFDDTSRFIVDGKGSRVQHLEIPIIRLDKLFIENQGLLGGALTEIDIASVRPYNRHLAGMTQPDDRENPQIAFIQSRFFRIQAQGLFPHPRLFEPGRQNVHIEGVFGYTDPDGTALGITPLMIRQATCRLVTRDLRLDSDACEKLFDKNKFRIVSDKEGSTTIKLQNLWLKGAFTGDPVIDNVLMFYKRPPRMAAI